MLGLNSKGKCSMWIEACVQYIVKPFGSTTHLWQDTAQTWLVMRLARQLLWWWSMLVVTWTGWPYWLLLFLQELSVKASIKSRKPVLTLDRKTLNDLFGREFLSLKILSSSILGSIKNGVLAVLLNPWVQIVFITQSFTPPPQLLPALPSMFLPHHSRGPRLGIHLSVICVCGIVFLVCTECFQACYWTFEVGW